MLLMGYDISAPAVALAVADRREIGRVAAAGMLTAYIGMGLLNSRSCWQQSVPERSLPSSCMSNVENTKGTCLQ